MTSRRRFRRPILLAAALAVFSAFAASPARADRCEDIANQLKGQVDNLKVGITAANMIYLSHPMAKEMSLGCKNRKYSNELYVKGNSRKPKPEFIAFVAGAAAIVFTLPKDELLKGVSSCFHSPLPFLLLCIGIHQRADHTLVRDTALAGGALEKRHRALRQA